jgi:tRNA(fMet)-specific endonuclease VapC
MIVRHKFYSKFFLILCCKPLGNNLSQPKRLSWTVSHILQQPKIRPLCNTPLLVLDTDHMSQLERSGTLRDRLFSVKSGGFQIATTIISYEEQMRGWMAFIARAPRLETELEAYKRLHQLLQVYRQTIVLDFDEYAARELQRLRSNKIRLGSMDMKIAAIVLSHGGAILLSKNLGDFSQVPALKVEDWIT